MKTVPVIALKRVPPRLLITRVMSGREWIQTTAGLIYAREWAEREARRIRSHGHPVVIAESPSGRVAVARNPKLYHERFRTSHASS